MTSRGALHHWLSVRGPHPPRSEISLRQSSAQTAVATITFFDRVCFDGGRFNRSDLPGGGLRVESRGDRRRHTHAQLLWCWHRESRVTFGDPDRRSPVGSAWLSRPISRSGCICLSACGTAERRR